MRKDTIIGTTMINVKGEDLCVAIEQGDGSGPPLLLISPRRYLDPSYMASIAPILYGEEFRQESELTQTNAQLIKAPHGRGYIMQLMAGIGWTSISWSHRLRQPTLVLAGNDEVIVPPINATILARLIPHAMLRIFNGGHLFLLTESEQVASLIHAFLRDESPFGIRG